MQSSVVLVGANFRTWVSAVRHLYALLAVGIWTPSVTERHSPTPRLDSPYPQPPYLETNVEEYMVSLFEADRAAIEPLLPRGVRPAASNTVGVSHYIVRERPALAPLQATYLFAEVEGREDPSGGKRRHILWGLFSPDFALAQLGEVLELPMRVGSTAFAQNGSRLQGTGLSNGKQMIVSELSAKGDGPLTLGGVLHYPSVRRAPSARGEGAVASELIIQAIAWTAKVQIADLVSIKLDFPEGHALKKLEPKRLLYAYFGKDLKFEFADQPEVRKQ